MSLSLRSYATPCLRYAMAARTRAVSSRAFSQSRAVRAKKEEEDDEGDSGDEAEDKKSQRRGRRGPFRGPGTKYEDPAFVQWLRTDGEKFRKVTPEGRQYLGGLQTPFPLNPTFKPPMPMPDATRTQLYLDYMRDNLTIREISRKYNISLRRVEACIRLKHVEFEMRMGRMPETAFTTVMERALGIEAVLQEKERRAQERAEEERLALQVEDAQTPVTLAGGHAAAVAQKLQEDRWPEEALEDIDADALSEEDRWQKKQEKLEEDEETNEEPYPFLADDKLADFMHDLADPKAPAAPYIKMYFEPVEEIVGKEPMLDNLLRKLRGQAQTRAAKRESPQLSVQQVQRGKKTFEFTDVGTAFMTERDIHARSKAAQRRQTVQAKKTAEKLDRSTEAKEARHEVIRRAALTAGGQSGEVAARS